MPFPFAPHILDIAVKAGDIIMQHYTGKLEVVTKSDNSPVTIADVKANQYIVTELARLTPDIPIISEENTVQLHSNDPLLQQHFWLVDPLDGTRAFINRSGQFTVNIGLIEQGVAVFGVIYLPVTRISYFTGEDGYAYKRDAAGNTTRLSVKQPDADGLIIVASKSHRTPETEAYIKRLHVKSLITGASSAKFCLVAEGSADLYPRFGRTMEWDTAAGHAIVNAAGGRVETEDGKTLGYAKPDFANPAFIVKASPLSFLRTQESRPERPRGHIT